MKMIVGLVAGLLIPSSIYWFWKSFDLQWWPGLILGVIACYALGGILDDYIRPTISQTIGLFFLSVPTILIIVTGFQGGIPAIPAAILSTILVPLIFFSFRKITR